LFVCFAFKTNAFISGVHLKTLSIQKEFVFKGKFYRHTCLMFVWCLFDCDLFNVCLCVNRNRKKGNTQIFQFSIARYIVNENYIKAEMSHSNKKWTNVFKMNVKQTNNVKNIPIVFQAICCSFNYSLLNRRISLSLMMSNCNKMHVFLKHKTSK
jgi:hypothetical protein